jgi:hypothetical protein
VVGGTCFGELISSYQNGLLQYSRTACVVPYLNKYQPIHHDVELN